MCEHGAAANLASSTNSSREGLPSMRLLLDAGIGS